MTRWTLDPQVRFRRVLDEGVVLAQRSREVIGVSLLGLRILELLREGRDRDEILSTLVAEVDVAEATLAGDVDAFVADLVAAGVLAEAS